MISYSVTDRAVLCCLLLFVAGFANRVCAAPPGPVGAASAVVQGPVGPPAGAKPGLPPAPIFDVRKYGAKGDGQTYDTAAIQKAIDACAGSGGSVYLAKGNYVTAQLTLRGKMTFYLEKDAALLGGLNPADYPELMPEKTAASANRRSLLFADKADGLVLDGGGVIDGRGQQLKMDGREPLRPSLMRIFSSKDVEIKNLNFKNPRMWSLVFSECERLTIERIKLTAPPRYCPNLDGVDVCDSKDVLVRNNLIETDDDSICLKTHGKAGLQNIRIENNIIKNTGANAIKVGTASRGPISGIRITNNVIREARYGGLCIESVDGSAISDFTVSGLEMHGVAQPIFVRLATRSGNGGSLGGVVIERVRATGTHARTAPGSTITGVPGVRIAGVLVRDCEIEMPGGLATRPKVPPEREKDYPQSNLFGNPPGWAFYVRHADGVVFERVTVWSRKKDVRPWLASDDATVRTVDCRDLGVGPR